MNLILIGHYHFFFWFVFVLKQAIEFAKEQDDEDLWEDLINYSLDKPGTGLLFCSEEGLTLETSAQ